MHHQENSHREDGFLPSHEKTERMFKMKKKNWIALLLALVMMFALAACGAKETPSDTPEPANALEKIKSEGVLTVTLSPDFSLGVKLVIEPMSFDACQSAVYTGSVPMSISGYSWTEERAQNYELSDYYYAGENETEQVLLIRKDDAAKYTKPEDFDGQDVGAQNASLQMQMVTDQLSKANPITIGDISVGVMELKAGNIEALAVAKGNGEMIVDANPDLVKCSWQFAVEEKYEANLIIMAKGETELLAAVNEALAKAKAEGLYAKWYEEAVELGKSENAKELTLD